MDLFETLGLGPRMPEENELYVAIYADPNQQADTGDLQDAASEADLEAAASGQPLAVADQLEAMRARCRAWMLPYISDYVWNKDPLVLRSSARHMPPWERRQRPTGGRGGGGDEHRVTASSPDATTSGSRSGGEGCVWAVMRFGDAVDDEWWAVWLLLRMTRELQDLSVQVWDNDGQFLLIEAAYALPRWLKPETSEHRVWLRRGRLHVIPLPSAAAPDLPASPTPAQALAVLREGRYATASPRVQRPIDERLSGYPAAARTQQQHVARCLLPAPLAAALRSEPQLVAALVEAFYYRDAEDMRAAARMRLLPPSMERSPVLVRMTRCQYAQLSQQRFAAPRGMPMPPPDSPLGRAADLGLKLCVAAEIICAQQPAVSAGMVVGATAAGATVRQGQQEALEVRAGAETVDVGAGSVLSESSLAGDPMWRRFKTSLESNGYFQGNIPGSKRYKELLATALEAFVGDAAAADGPQARDPRRRLAELVAAAVAAGVKTEDVTGPDDLTAEDDDSWLDQNPNRLQAELERRQAELLESSDHLPRQQDADNRSPARESGARATSQEQAQEVDADNIASKLRSFIQQLSGLEGVESLDAPPVVPSGKSDADAGVDFQPERFLRELRNVLGPELAAAGRGLDDTEDDDQESLSSEEGSSFFSDEDEDDDLTSDAEASEKEDSREGVQDTRAGADGAQQGARCPSKQVPNSEQQSKLHRQAPQKQEEVLSSTRAAGVLAASSGRMSPAKPQAAAATQPAAPKSGLKRGFIIDTAPAHSVRRPTGRCPEPVAAAATTVAAVRATTSTANTRSRGASQPAGVSAANGPSAVRPGGEERANSMGGIGGLRSGAEGADQAWTTAQHALRWEVGTATDSDDEDDNRQDSVLCGSRRRCGIVGDDGEEEEAPGASSEEEDEEVAEDMQATTQLMAALGIDAGSSVGDRVRDSGAGSSRAGAVGRPQRGGRPGERRDRAGGEDFMDLYDDVMRVELAGTTLTSSFEGVAPSQAAPGGASQSGGILGVGSGEGGGLQPVDLDMNLVRNLLRSYAAQQGNAGPAGNIAAMLGVSLVAGDVDG